MSVVLGGVLTIIKKQTVCISRYQNPQNDYYGAPKWTKMVGSVSSAISPMSISFNLVNVGWYCVTKGRMFFRAVLLLFWSDVFLSENLTSKRCFSTVAAGVPLFLWRAAKFLMFSSKVYVVRNTSTIDPLRNLSPLYITVSKTAVSVSDIPAVNLIVGWKLFAFNSILQLPSSIFSLFVSHSDTMSSDKSFPIDGCFVTLTQFRVLFSPLAIFVPIAVLCDWRKYFPLNWS